MKPQNQILHKYMSFENNITFANEETLSQTWWLAKNTIPRLLTDFEVEFSISWLEFPEFSINLEKILFSPDFSRDCGNPDFCIHCCSLWNLNTTIHSHTTVGPFTSIHFLPRWWKTT